MIADSIGENGSSGDETFPGPPPRALAIATRSAASALRENGLPSSTHAHTCSKDGPSGFERLAVEGIADTGREEKPFLGSITKGRSGYPVSSCTFVRWWLMNYFCHQPEFFCLRCRLACANVYVTSAELDPPPVFVQRCQCWLTSVPNFSSVTGPGNFPSSH